MISTTMNPKYTVLHDIPLPPSVPPIAPASPIKIFHLDFHRIWEAAGKAAAELPTGHHVPSLNEREDIFLDEVRLLVSEAVTACDGRPHEPAYNCSIIDLVRLQVVDHKNGSDSCIGCNTCLWALLAPLCVIAMRETSRAQRSRRLCELLRLWGALLRRFKGGKWEQVECICHLEELWDEQHMATDCFGMVLRQLYEEEVDLLDEEAILEWGSWRQPLYNASQHSATLDLTARNQDSIYYHSQMFINWLETSESSD